MRAQENKRKLFVKNQTSMPRVGSITKCFGSCALSGIQLPLVWICWLHLLAVCCANAAAKCHSLIASKMRFLFPLQIMPLRMLASSSYLPFIGLLQWAAAIQCREQLLPCISAALLFMPASSVSQQKNASKQRAMIFSKCSFVQVDQEHFPILSRLPFQPSRLSFCS